MKASEFKREVKSKLALIGQTLKESAEVAGVNYPTMVNIVNGSVTPSNEVFENLFNHLGIQDQEERDRLVSLHQQSRTEFVRNAAASKGTEIERFRILRKYFENLSVDEQSQINNLLIEVVEAS